MNLQRGIRIFFVLVFILSTISSPVKAQEPTPPPDQPQIDHFGDSSSAAPAEGIAVYNTYTVTPQDGAGGGQDILLIQTSNPWNSSADTIVLNTLGYTYRIATWTDIDTHAVDIFSYPVVLIVNDQVQAFYDSYANHIGDFERFVSQGNTLLFFASSDGWARGTLRAALPGGVRLVTPNYQSYNYIENADHPIISAVLSQPPALVNADLYSNYCSHGHFTSLPVDTDIILKDNSGNPTLIEYRIGNGRVIASTQTWEHNWVYHTGGDGYGTFARKALDDVFLYVMSGGVTPKDVQMSFFIDDAPDSVIVQKSRGSYVDFVAKITTDQAVETSVLFEVPGNVLGKPTLAFTRVNPWDPEIKTTFSDKGGGKYQAKTRAQSVNGKFYKELVLRFKVPSDAKAQQNINIKATLSIKNFKVANPTKQVKLNIIDYARTLIVTNRTLLYSYYHTKLKKTENEVAPLLEELYTQAANYNGEVFYVDLHSDTAKKWAQVIDYSSEDKANTAVKTVDELIDSWYNRLTKANEDETKQTPEFLLIVGGDEVIPFYRVDDKNYDDLEAKYSRDRIDGQENDPTADTIHNNYFLTDNIYGDVGGGKSDWEEGKLELALGRIVGHSAKAMLNFISNASQKTPTVKEAVVATRSDNHDAENVLAALNSKHIKIYSEANPDLIEITDWSRDQWITALGESYQILYYHAHGALDGWAGTDSWNGARVKPIDMPAGKIGENHPLFTTIACDFAIPTDLSGAEWSPEANDSNPYKIIDLGASGFLGSTGLNRYGGVNELQYGEQFGHSFITILLPTTKDTSEFVGKAILQAKQDYSVSGGNFHKYDNKALLEYVYYGLPWSTFRIPDNAPAEEQQFITPLGTLLSPQYDDTLANAQANGEYSTDLQIGVSSYTFQSADEFELLSVPGADQSYTEHKPILPEFLRTIILPLGSKVTAIELLGEKAIPLGPHNIPAAEPISEKEPSSGYTDQMDVTGVYPATRYAYQVVELADHAELRLGVILANFNVESQEVTLFDSTTLRIHYTSPVPVALEKLELDQPEYTVGQAINVSASVRNAGADNASLTSKVKIYNSANVLVSEESGGTSDILAGESAQIDLSVSAPTQPGNYHANVIFEKDGVFQASSMASFRVLAGKIVSFDAPEEILSNQYGQLDLAFENLSADAVTVKATVLVYDALGSEVAHLLERYFVVEGQQTGQTAWMWSPTGLYQGTYSLRAKVEAGGVVYTAPARSIYLEVPLVNDEYEQAITIPVRGGKISFSDVQHAEQATSNVADPIYASKKISTQGMHTIWYQFTPFVDGSIKLDTADSDYDTLLGVWVKDAEDNWKSIKWHDDVSSKNKTSKLSLSIKANATYYIEVASKQDVAGWSRFHFFYTPVSTKYDLIKKPSTIKDTGSTLEQGFSQDIWSATTSKLDPKFSDTSIGQGQRSIWYKFTPMYNGQITIDTMGSNFDTVVGIWRGSTSALANVGWDDNTAGAGLSRLSAKLAGRVTYYIEVASKPGNTNSNMRLNFRYAPVSPAGAGVHQNSSSRVYYLGSWTQDSYRNLSYTKDDVASLTFTGTRIQLHYYNRVNAGKLTVMIDGKTVKTISQSGKYDLSKVWTSSKLKAGMHTITVKNASGKQVNIDSFEVFP